MPRLIGELIEGTLRRGVSERALDLAGRAEQSGPLLLALREALRGHLRAPLRLLRLLLLQSRALEDLSESRPLR